MKKIIKQRNSKINISSTNKIGERRKMFGVWFRWTGTCWVNEYIPKTYGL